MKHLCKFFHLLTLFFLLLTLILASSAFAQVVPTDAGQPRGTIPRITKNTNVTKISSNSSSVLSQAINFIVESVIAYGTTYIVERIVSKLFRKCRAEVYPQQKCSVLLYAGRIKRCKCSVSPKVYWAWGKRLFA